MLGLFSHLTAVLLIVSISLGNSSCSGGLRFISPHPSFMPHTVPSFEITAVFPVFLNLGRMLWNPLREDPISDCKVEEKLLKRGYTQDES